MLLQMKKRYPVNTGLGVFSLHLYIKDYFINEHMSALMNFLKLKGSRIYQCNIVDIIKT